MFTWIGRLAHCTFIIRSIHKIVRGTNATSIIIQVCWRITSHTSLISAGWAAEIWALSNNITLISCYIHVPIFITINTSILIAFSAVFENLLTRQASRWNLNIPCSIITNTKTLVVQNITYFTGPTNLCILARSTARNKSNARLANEINLKPVRLANTCSIRSQTKMTWLIAGCACINTRTCNTTVHYFRAVFTMSIKRSGANWANTRIIR